MNYTPILKGKFGEGAALSHLSSLTLNRTFPIIEIPPIPTKYCKDDPGVADGKERTLQEHLDVFVRGIADKVPLDLKFAIDFRNITEDEATPANPIEYVFSKFWAAGRFPSPVLGLEGDFKFAPKLLDIAGRSQTGSVVRIDRASCNFPTAVMRQLSDLSQTAGLSFAEMAIVFDYGLITRGDVDDIVNECQAIEEDFPLLKFRWSSVVATSMPNSVTMDLKAYSTDSVPRLEWLSWKRAQTKLLGFGDYGVGSPDYFDKDIRLITLGGKARYTTPDSWLIVKGERLEKNGDQFHKLAQIIRESISGKSSGYSWGDRCIHDCADFEIGPGNLTKWLAYTTNHHLTMVARQLASSA